MSYHEWHVGMKVVCIKVDAWELSPGAFDLGHRTIFPLHGQVLTIRDMEEWRGIIYLRFVEIANPIAAPPHNQEASFAIKWFRPVQPRKTDISIFTAMLTKTKVPA